MKRSGLILLAGVLIASLASPVSAKKKTFEHTLFLHGRAEVAEADLPDAWVSDMWYEMTADEPSAATPKSMWVTNYLVGPNDRCSGNGLLPTWKGPFSGTVKGNVEVELHTVATPAAQLSVELYADVNGQCTSEVAGVDEYIEPVAEAIVDLPPGAGTITAKFKKLKFKVLSHLVLMVHPAHLPSNPAGEDLFRPQYVRLLYDSSDFGSSITLTCVKKPCVD